MTFITRGGRYITPKSETTFINSNRISVGDVGETINQKDAMPDPELEIGVHAITASNTVLETDCRRKDPRE